MTNTFTLDGEDAVIQPGPNEELVTEFLSVLDGAPPAGRQKEQVVQDFLEVHTELIPTPFLLNHGLQFDSVVSKFPLDTALVTDMLYVTKSSDRWYVVLVEFEQPDKPIFKTTTKQAQATQQFNGALDQVRGWRTFLEANKDEVLRRLEPLRRPLGRNPVYFKYLLVIGRSANKNLTPARMAYLERLRQESGLEVLTYDSLIGYYLNWGGSKKNILRLAGTQYEFKHMYVPPCTMFSHVGPDVFALSKDQGDTLAAMGYEIARWREGQYPALNGMQSLKNGLSQVKSMRQAGRSAAET